MEQKKEKKFEENEKWEKPNELEVTLKENQMVEDNTQES